MRTNYPLIEILETKELKNGDLNITFEINEKGIELIKKHYKKEKVTKKMIKDFVYKAIVEYYGETK